MSSQTDKTRAPYAAQHLADEHHFIRMGWLVIGIGLVGFFLWAAFAPLDKGVSSPGSVTVSGYRKTVQASAGGIISTIAVKEGDKVQAGQLLVQLSKTQPQAQVDSLRDQYYTALATESRLLAERDALATITFSHELQQLQTQPRVAEILLLQHQLFTSRRQGLQSEIDGYKQSIEGMRAQLQGLQDSKVNKHVQLSALREQVDNMKPLVAEGYLPRNRYLEIQRQFAEVNSSINETVGHIGQVQNQILEAQQKINQRLAEYQREVRTQLAQTQMEASECRNKLEMANFDLNNTVITSPVDGTVVGLNVFTQGGMVNAGEALMDILPGQASLVVDAHLRVDLIDKVYEGLPVDLMFTAFNQNKTPKIAGTVTLVSADRLLDKSSGEPYYQMQVAVSAEGRKKLNLEEIKPGMPVEVFIKTGSRSLLSYLFKPVLDRAHTSLTEE